MPGMTRFSMKLALCFVGASLLGACAHSSQLQGDVAASVAEPVTVHPEIWPQGRSGLTRDPAVEARIVKLLSELTVEQKVGQIIQADIGSVTPAEVKQYRLGTILNGGSSGPYGDDRAAPEQWVKLADEYWDASMDPDGVKTPVPILWGIDAVHGHSNVVGATIFPHNIGLGAANDPELIERIGAATAVEVAVTGLDWTFAPTLAVARDDRWGRTYESYSEDPKIVGAYGGAMVRGLQGVAGTDGFLGPDRVIATAKHFIADGGTKNGKDQGDAAISEALLRDVHAAGYFSAIEAGVQSAMASFSSWNGQKMHGNQALLQDVLFGRLGFDGLVVGDWNAHGKLPGCSNEDCADAFKAGVDIYMAPDGWKALYAATLAEVRSGEISMVRLDQAVARILRVKIRAGAFEKGLPSGRPLAGKTELMGSVKHRAIAREAVRKSLVLLKNNGGVLPLRQNANILVVGSGADDIAQQTGGWTISWQGLDTTHADFPQGQTIIEGIREVASAAGGHVEYSVDGSFTKKPDVAIIVYGEKPYAEFKGDLADVEFKPENGSHLEQMRALKAAGIPVVSVFLSGRPLWVNRELNLSDAFVAAWLPGSEAGGIADVLFEKSKSGKKYDFAGRLSFSWPRTPDQTAVNLGDEGYDPLFAYGHGLTKVDSGVVGKLDETMASTRRAIGKDIFTSGRSLAPWTLKYRQTGGALTLSNFDRFAQEDAKRITWNDAGWLAFKGPAGDMSELATPDAAIMLSMRVETAPVGPVIFRVENGDTILGSVDIGDMLRALPVGEWAELRVPLKCISKEAADWRSVTAPVVIKASSPFTLGLSGIKIADLGENDDACPAAAN